MRGHTGETQKCQISGKRYQSLSNLHIHAQVHTRKEPLVCHSGGLSFNENPHLMTPSLLNSSENTYPCESNIKPELP